MHQILIVDEEEHLLWALEKNLIPDRDDIKVITASGGERGLELLRDEDIEVLICDIKMPGDVDGFQLILRAKEIAPDARVVIMTAFGSNRIQNLAERVGITHYVEKPFNISDLRDVVLELLDAKEGFQGVLSDLELTDIIQMLCLAKRTALLHLKHRDHRGRIVFERGDVTHAEFNDTKGSDAVYQMLALRQGDIYMQSDFQNTEHTIHVGWQDLLLEGMRRADEHRANISEVSDASVVDDTETIEFSEEHVQSLFDDSGEITLGMPPRLVSQVEEGDEVSAALGDEPSGSFFTDEELAEIESAGRQLSGTANGLDHLLDKKTRELIEQHERTLAEQGGSSLNTLSEPYASPSSLEEFSQPMPGRPTDSSDFPAQSRGESPSGPSARYIPTPSSPFPVASSSPSLGIAEPGFPPASTPRVVAEEVHSTTTSGSQPMVSPQPKTSRTSGSWAAPRTSGRQMAPTLMLQSPGILNSRALLSEFAKECTGVLITGLFSFDDGMALDFHVAANSPYEGDVLSAFFRDVAACAELTSRSLAQGGGFEELQISLERELILLRRIPDTPYIHIASMDKNVRLGIAIVLMRRYGDRLAECFNR
jgi:DNA-binding response OmpR family regulator